MIRSYSFLCLIIVNVCFFGSCTSKSAKKQDAFEAILESARDCPDPKPSYTKKPPIINRFYITVVNGKRYFSGNTTIIRSTPFLNVSARTYAIESSGNRNLKLKLPHVSCRNVFAKTLLMFANISLEPKNCTMKKGVFLYEQLDVNKLVHAVPTWHAPGGIVHEIQLVAEDETMACVEIVIKIVPL